MTDCVIGSELQVGSLIDGLKELGMAQFLGLGGIEEEKVGWVVGIYLYLNLTFCETPKIWAKGRTKTGNSTSPFWQMTSVSQGL